MTDDVLKRDLKARHLMMISIGGVIGAGYFLGAGAAIKVAGPAVIISYAFGGLITILIVALLSEMAVAMPVAGSFQVYASKSYGPCAGFVTGWTYWLAFLIGPAAETIAAGTFLNLWFPTVPIWIFCLAVAILMTIINLIGVLVFGEVEFWLAMVKVVALVVFIIWAAVALFGLPMQTDISFANLSGNGGFAPFGAAGVIAAMMMVMFAYGGTECIGTAAEESHNPAKDIPKALSGTVLRIVILYVGSMTALIMVLPWDQAGVSSSPFVDAFAILGGPAARNIMNFVVITAALSCIDTGVYATSRMLFSLSRDGMFPKFFSNIHPKRKTPVNAIAASTCVLFVGALMFLLFPSFAFVWLGSLSGFGFIFTWLMIALSQPRMRRYVESTDPSLLKWKMPFYPYSQWLAVVLIAAVLAGQLFVGGWVVLAAGAIWLIFASLYYLLVARKSARRSVS